MEKSALFHDVHDARVDDDDGDAGNVDVAKATAMVVLFCASFVIGNIPIKLSKWFKWDTNAKDNQYVKCLLGLGGGVLLCTTFIHLLPEVTEQFEKLDISLHTKIHYAELLMCLGFFTIYFVDECVHMYIHRTEKSKAKNHINISPSIRRSEFEHHDNLNSLESPKHNGHNNRNENYHVGHSHVIVDYSENHSTFKAIRGLLVVLALSVHELFEGLTVGLEYSASNVWYMFGAVSAHKLVIAFCVGVELVTSNMKTVIVIIYIFLFAVVSPLGIGIGIIISNGKYNSTNVVSVILQGLATGTLLYVVFFEILQADKKTGLKQYLSVLIGFLIMFGITLIESD